MLSKKGETIGIHVFCVVFDLKKCKKVIQWKNRFQQIDKELLQQQYHIVHSKISKPQNMISILINSARKCVNNSQNMDTYGASTKCKIKNGKHPIPLFKIEVHSIYSQQNMTQLCQK